MNLKGAAARLTYDKCRIHPDGWVKAVTKTASTFNPTQPKTLAWHTAFNITSVDLNASPLHLRSGDSTNNRRNSEGDEPAQKIATADVLVVVHTFSSCEQNWRDEFFGVRHVFIRDRNRDNTTYVVWVAQAEIRIIPTGSDNASRP